MADRSTLRRNHETFRAYAKRLASAGLDRFEAARRLADAVEEDFVGTGSGARNHFQVELRGEDIAVVCLSDRAESWLRKRLQRGKSEVLNPFAGRSVALERPTCTTELRLETTGTSVAAGPRRAKLPPPPPDMDVSTCSYCGRKAKPVLVAGEPRCDVHYTCGPDGRLPAHVRRSARSRGDRA